LLRQAAGWPDGGGTHHASGVVQGTSWGRWPQEGLAGGRDLLSRPVSRRPYHRGDRSGAIRRAGDPPLGFDRRGMPGNLSAGARRRFVSGHCGPKLWISEPQTRYQPSISTKKISLNGRDSTFGGKLTMPIDMTSDATTMSMIRNGRNRRKPISKARLSSLI